MQDDEEDVRAYVGSLVYSAGRARVRETTRRWMQGGPKKKGCGMESEWG